MCRDIGPVEMGQPKYATFFSQNRVPWIFKLNIYNLIKKERRELTTSTSNIKDLKLASLSLRADSLQRVCEMLRPQESRIPILRGLCWQSRGACIVCQEQKQKRLKHRIKCQQLSSSVIISWCLIRNVPPAGSHTSVSSFNKESVSVLEYHQGWVISVLAD